ncbi:hypothetical protein A8B75_14985 [Sphingomonadales bacterium EhC05]|nr:hypothetical protein A8B75_14985 [Sphingomonadales bacterium EhC05]
MQTTTKTSIDSNTFAKLIDNMTAARAALAARPEDECPQIDKSDPLCDALVTAEETLVLHPAKNLAELIQKIKLLSIETDVADALTPPVVFGDIYRLAGTPH